MDSFFRDLRQSLRMFAQSPAFTLAAVAALTLGIGANTAIFSVLDAVLLKPLSAPDPGRVVFLITRASVRGRLRPSARRWRRRQPTDPFPECRTDWPRAVRSASAAR